jgi:hypothetical protein
LFPGAIYDDRSSFAGYAAALAASRLTSTHAEESQMSSDKQFTATGGTGADISFQTKDTGGTIKTGVNVTGTVAGVVAAVPTANARTAATVKHRPAADHP